MRSADAPTIPSSGALSSMSSVRASHPLSSLVLLANLDVTRPLPRDHAMETTTRTTTAPGVSYNRLRRAARVRVLLIGLCGLLISSPAFAMQKEFDPTEMTVAEIHDAIRTGRERKSTRLNSRHVAISCAVFCF